MNTLYFESAGMTGTQKNDVPNCRLRTRVKNDNGEVIYLEIGSGYENRFKGIKYALCVDHLFFQKDERTNYSEALAHLSRTCDNPIEYTKKNILKFVNEKLGCSFDSMECKEDLRVHETKKPLAVAKKKASAERTV